MSSAARADSRTDLTDLPYVLRSAVTLVTLANRTLFTHLRVCSVVMTLDDKVDKSALYAHLLDLNANLCGAAFAIDANKILMMSERSTIDIDRSEVRETIRVVLPGTPEVALRAAA